MGTNWFWRTIESLDSPEQCTLLFQDLYETAVHILVDVGPIETQPHRVEVELYGVSSFPFVLLTERAIPPTSTSICSVSSLLTTCIHLLSNVVYL